LQGTNFPTYYQGRFLQNVPGCLFVVCKSMREPPKSLLPSLEEMLEGLGRSSLRMKDQQFVIDSFVVFHLAGRSLDGRYWFKFNGNYL